VERKQKERKVMVLDDKYLLKQLLGQGASSQVYLACLKEDKEALRAVKIYKSDFLS